MENTFVIKDNIPFYVCYISNKKNNYIHIVAKEIIENADEYRFDTIKCINEKNFVKFLANYITKVYDSFKQEYTNEYVSSLFAKQTYSIDYKLDKVTFNATLTNNDISELKRCIELFNFSQIYNDINELYKGKENNIKVYFHFGDLLHNVSFNNTFNSKMCFLDTNKIVNLYEFNNCAQFFLFTLFHFSNIVGIKLRRCDNCNQFFYTRSRSDEKYCSDKCRIDFNKHNDNKIFRAYISYRNYIYELCYDNIKLEKKRDEWKKQVKSDLTLYSDIYTSYSKDEGHVFYSIMLCSLFDNTVTDELDDNFIPFDVSKYCDYPLDDLVNNFKKIIKKKWKDIYEKE